MNLKSSLGQLTRRIPEDFDPYEFSKNIGIHPDSTKEFTAAIEDSGEIVGVLFTGHMGFCYSFDIAVSPDHQRKGYGSTLMEFAIDEYEELSYAFPELEFCLDAVNPVAVKMLKQRGFQITRQQGGHTYLTREANIRMSRRLASRYLDFLLNS